MSKIIAFLFQMKCPECNGFLEIYMLDMVLFKMNNLMVRYSGKTGNT